MPIRLLCDAIPFCYGPAAALEATVDALLDGSDQVDVHILASGSTRELLARAGLRASLLEVDSEDTDALAHVPFDQYDAFLSVCNPESFRAARQASTPAAYLDFLLWMHDGPAPERFSADLYIAEDYPGTREWIARRGEQIPNLALVPPIVTPPTRRDPEAGFLLVGLGGLYSRLTQPGRNNNYAPLVVRKVLDAIPAGRFQRVLVAGPAQLATTMAELMGDVGHVEYASLSHRAFLDVLSRAELFVSHPGLYAAFEATSSAVPTAFLPPSNYTQVLQLRHYRSVGLAEASLAWEDIGLPTVPAGLSEPEGVRAVLEVVRRAEQSSGAVRALGTFLEDIFSWDANALKSMGVRQRQVASSFGAAGPRRAARQILGWLSGVQTSTG